MKAKILLCSMLILGSLSYAAEPAPTDSVAQEVMSEVKNIEAEYQALMQKEAERKEEFKQEKATLEKEVQELKERQLGREELYAKLKEDSKVRWHRDEYKKLLKRFDEYYNKLEQKIADKEQQIVELTKLLEVLKRSVTESYDKYEFYNLFQGIHYFAAVDMSAFYLDIIKDRLYTEKKDSVARRAAQTVMYEVLMTLTKMIAPILSFTAEEIGKVYQLKQENQNQFS